MIIVGEWLLGTDGVTRPTVSGAVQAADGSLHDVVFLIDSGADRSVFTASAVHRLNLPAAPQPPDYHLEGVGGSSAFIFVRTMIELTCGDGRPARIRGEYAGFVDPAAADFSILGRDVLDNFDVIQSRRRKQILLLAGNHQYQIAQA
jgi:Aspartyl protease